MYTLAFFWNLIGPGIILASWPESDFSLGKLLCTSKVINLEFKHETWKICASYVIFCSILYTLFPCQSMIAFILFLILQHFHLHSQSMAGLCLLATGMVVRLCAPLPCPTGSGAGAHSLLHLGERLFKTPGMFIYFILFF